MLLEFFENAKIDLLFFLIMFIILLIAFTLVGYHGLGHVIFGFSTFMDGLLYVLKMIQGNIPVRIMFETDFIIAIIFMAIYILIIFLVFLNLFVAIVFAHYKALREY